MRKLLSPGERSPLLDRNDRTLMWAVTLVFTVFTLLDLGTLRFPQTVWTAGTGQVATLDLGETRDVSALWFNGNIAVGKLLVTADDGTTYEYSQAYGEMFSWRRKQVSFHTRYLRLELVSGDVSLNELAVFDPDGRQIPVHILEPESAALADEQDTVPENPGYFNGMYFDEIYHARTAYEFLHTMSVYEWTHPPLGKAIIALGIVLFGMTPFGWRVMPALFGAAMLPIVYILGKRFFRRRDYAFLGMSLFALDTMHFAQTRIATVDVFIVFFILLMYLFMVDYLRLEAEDQPLKKTLVPLGACGVSFGLGTASKWTGLYAGVGLAVLFFAHIIGAGIAAKHAGKLRDWWARTWRTILFCCVFFLLIPVAIYFLSYIPFYRYELSRRPDVHALGVREMLDILIHQQESMFKYHSGLTATHMCQSTWYEWPFTARSVWFFSGSKGELFSSISSFGSPAVWWVSAVGTLCFVVEALFGRTRTDPDYRKKALIVLLVAIAANYVPWTFVPRCTFQYHFFPTLPFMLLAGVMLLQHLEERGEVPGWGKWCWLGVAAVYFLLLLPACSGLPMPRLYARFLEYVLPTGILFHGAV